MHELSSALVKRNRRQTKQSPRVFDLKAVYAILIRAYLRNHSDAFKLEQQVNGEHHA